MNFFFSKIARFAAFATLLSCVTACKNEASDSQESIQEIPADGKISAIIRSPISADSPTDTVNVAKMVFEETTFDFGEVDEGKMVTHSFRFTNTGKVPLVINDAHSTCGCTVPKWPEEAVAPGDSGEITVRFNTKGKPDFQEKPVTIAANTFPSNTKIFIKGFVHKAKDGQ